LSSGNGGKGRNPSLRKSKKKQLIAPYADIRSIRTVETKDKRAKVFEIVTSSGAHKVDVLQADDFLAGLRERAPSAAIL
jgi:hypothetical protein